MLRSRCLNEEDRRRYGYSYWQNINRRTHRDAGARDRCGGKGDDHSASRHIRRCGIGRLRAADGLLRAKCTASSSGCVAAHRRRPINTCGGYVICERRGCVYSSSYSYCRRRSSLKHNSYWKAHNCHRHTRSLRWRTRDPCGDRDRRTDWNERWSCVSRCHSTRRVCRKQSAASRRSATEYRSTPGASTTVQCPIHSKICRII